MTQDVTIDCGEGRNAYQVNLKVDDLEAFYKADNRLEAAGKKGEECVKALTATGLIYDIKRKKDGKLSDGPNGEPAYESFDSKGRLIAQECNQNDIMTDGPNGKAAVLGFHPNGLLALIQHHQDGELCGPTLGFDEKGRLNLVGFNTLDERTLLGFNSRGTLTTALVYNAVLGYNDEHMKQLNKKELAAYAEQHKEEIAGYFELAKKESALYLVRSNKPVAKVAKTAAARGPRA